MKRIVLVHVPITTAIMAVLANNFIPSSAVFTLCDRTISLAFVIPSSINEIVSGSMERSLFSIESPSALNMADEETDYVSPMRRRPPPKGGDTAYTSENILRQLRYYNEIRKVGGKDCVHDIYVRDPTPSEDGVRFWFVGKVAACTSAELAVARQVCNNSKSLSN